MSDKESEESWINLEEDRGWSQESYRDYMKRRDAEEDALKKGTYKYEYEYGKPSDKQIGGSHYKDCVIQPVDYIVKNNQTTFLNKIPKILWFGTKNQYHRWLLGEAPWFKKGEVGQSKGFVRLDFGYSYLDGRPVKSIILDAVRWTVIINLITILIAYLISIPIGVITAVKKGTTFDKITRDAKTTSVGKLSMIGGTLGLLTGK